MELSCAYQYKPRRRTCNTSYVCTAFGIEFDCGENVIANGVKIDYAPGQIVLFLGSSGSGKSSLLRAASSQLDDVAELTDPSTHGKSIIDTLGPDPHDAAHLLSLCGLAEPMLMLRTPDELSEGQRYRYMIAACLAAGAGTIVADEWCAKLDRVTAKVVSKNARKIADGRAGPSVAGLTGFILATTHEDIVDDLQPDVIVRCGPSIVEVENHRPFRRPISFHRELQITEGAASDWPYFAGWHYRGHGLGPVRRVFVLWHGQTPAGICIFGFGPLSSSARNHTFGITGQLTRLRARRLNRDFATISRLVLDPRYRGASIAAAFLRTCCKLTEWPWIELVSEMAAMVPFCRAAGFKQISRPADLPPGGITPSADRSPWGKSGWTRDGFRDYQRRVRFSRPAYYLFDNRSSAGKITGPEALRSVRR